MKRLIGLFLAMSVALCVKAQTSIGRFEHVANSAAAETPDGVLNRNAMLSGSWTFAGVAVVGGDAALIRNICNEVLLKAGFAADRTVVIFGEGGAFGIVCNSETLPATWREDDLHTSVRISFSKIFTYGMTARIVKTDGGVSLLFPADRFTGFIERTLAILAREDTAAIITALSSAVDATTEMGFNLVRNYER